MEKGPTAYIDLWGYEFGLSVWQFFLLVVAVALLFLGFFAICRQLFRAWRVSRRARIWRSEETTAVVSAPDHAAGLPSDSSLEPIELESIQLRNFRGISQLNLDLTKESTLSGNWSCIAGINGAGKSSILQAIVVGLLGSDLVTEIGRRSLSNMRRQVAGTSVDAEILVTVREGAGRQELYVPISEFGVDEEKLAKRPDLAEMHAAWKRLRRQLLAGYGATRNLSRFVDTRYERTSPEVQRQMTMFDSAAQMADVNVLLGGEDDKPAAETFRRLVDLALSEDDIRTERSGGKVKFVQHSTQVDALDLPDGYRSTVAWMADFCAGWHAVHPDQNQGVDPDRLTGIVLLDEIGLHLHPTLEGSLISKLRRALPNVQFIVTTHSPLVLASFDRNELIILDRNEEDGVRELDRQVFGMSMDDVYEWLMGTSPGSNVIKELIDDGMNEEAALYLYQSKDYDEEQARDRLNRRREVARRLKEGS